jgi:peptide/nickel transport system permease protein
MMPRPAAVDDRVPVLRTVLSSVAGRVGVLLGGALLLVIAFGPLVSRFPADRIGVAGPAAPPSATHPLGTDALGRDVLSSLLNGGGSVLLAPLAAVAIAFALGGTLGLLAAYRGGLLDLVIARVFDVLLTVPPLLIVLILIAGVGKTGPVVIGAVGLVLAPWVGRVARGAAQAVVTADYVQAAVARGERTAWILRRELLPTIAAPLISAFSLYLTSGIIFVSTLGFLGLGEQPPSANWGLMVAENRGFITVNPWATVMPALGIAAVAVSCMLIADVLLRHIVRHTDYEAGQL